MHFPVPGGKVPLFKERGGSREANRETNREGTIKSRYLLGICWFLGESDDDFIDIRAAGLASAMFLI